MSAAHLRGPDVPRQDAYLRCDIPGRRTSNPPSTAAARRGVETLWCVACEEWHRGLLRRHATQWQLAR